EVAEQKVPQPARLGGLEHGAPGGVGLGAALQDRVRGGAADQVVPGLLLGGERGRVEGGGGVALAVADEHLERSPALGLSPGGAVGCGRCGGGTPAAAAAGPPSG